MTGKFKKILVAVNYKTKVNDPILIDTVKEIINKYKTEPYEQNGVIIGKMTPTEKKYFGAERIKSLTETYMTQDVPTLFIRDRIADNKVRSLSKWREETRIVQFTADWCNNGDEAGRIRNKRIFDFDLEEVIVFTSPCENNEEGLEMIQFMAYDKNIPLTVFSEGKKITEMYPVKSIPVEMEKEENKKKIPNRETIEYQRKNDESTRKIKRMYYEELKKKSRIKIVDNDEINTISTNTKNFIKNAKKNKKKSHKKTMTKEEIKMIEETYE